MFIVNDEDIKNSERLLLPEGEIFDKERREVICCRESKDVQACPGSGKTTTLLAKLAIISRQLPLKSSKGICVLTHTNVAVDEIRNKLEGKADILFQYPNHFGTIQSFVNKFLAVPAYVDRYGKRIARIDDEIYYEYVQRRAGRLDYGAKNWLDKKRIALADLRFSLNDFCITKKIDGPIIMNSTAPSYLKIEKFKEDILKEGVLCYEDAYSLAFEYLRKYPQLTEVISERFAYVFVDEMQDTDYIQNDLLERIFDRKKVVVQRIGDSNQSIFDSSSKSGWKITEDYLSISTSKRFSSNIADRVKTICLSPQNLIGNANIVDIQPKIIVFDDSSITKVLPKFGDLIIECNLHLLKKNIFKAVGWVGDPSKPRSICDYYEPYSKSGLNKRHDFDGLNSYLKMANTGSKESSVKSKSELLLGALLKSLRLLGVKRPNGLPYTESSFSEYLKTQHEGFYEELRLQMIQWCLKLYRGEDILQSIKNYITVDLCSQLGVIPNKELLLFLNNNSDSEILVDLQSNSFTHEKNNSRISIDISTVHSVKGETHTATLYLETYYNKKFDVQSILEYMKGKHVTPRLETTKKSLKMAYVGMTRPTHLLCVATHKDSKSHLEDLHNVGWDIYEV